MSDQWKWSKLLGHHWFGRWNIGELFLGWVQVVVVGKVWDCIVKYDIFGDNYLAIFSRTEYRQDDVVWLESSCEVIGEEVTQLCSWTPKLTQSFFF